MTEEAALLTGIVCKRVLQPGLSRKQNLKCGRRPWTRNFPGLISQGLNYECWEAGDGQVVWVALLVKLYVTNVVKKKLQDNALDLPAYIRTITHGNELWIVTGSKRSWIQEAEKEAPL